MHGGDVRVRRLGSNQSRPPDDEMSNQSSVDDKRDGRPQVRARTVRPNLGNSRKCSILHSPLLIFVDCQCPTDTNTQGLSGNADFCSIAFRLKRTSRESGGSPTVISTAPTCVCGSRGTTGMKQHLSSPKNFPPMRLVRGKG